MAFSSLRDLIPKAASKHGLKDEMNAALVISRSSAVLAKLISPRTRKAVRVRRFQKGVLWISTPNASAAQMIQSQSQALLDGINEGFPELVVHQVRTFQEVEVEEDHSLL